MAWTMLKTISTIPTKKEDLKIHKMHLKRHPQRALDQEVISECRTSRILTPGKTGIITQECSLDNSDDYSRGFKVNFQVDLEADYIANFSPLPRAEMLLGYMTSFSPGRNLKLR